MMRWNRQGIKSYAKDFLRNHYWKAFVVCLIVALVSGGSSNSNSNRAPKINNNYNDNYMMEEFDNNNFFEDNNKFFNFVRKGFRSPLFLITGGAIAVGVFIFAILMITVGYALEVGQSRFFLDGFKDDVSMSRLFSTFNSEEYFSIVKTQFLKSLYNFLWTLLFIIPGIVKSYEYRFVPYILAEEPNLDSNEVISRSREITYGHKMDIFVLDLSFIGWNLLGALLCGIGVFFVKPYTEATDARLYNILSGKDYYGDDLYSNVDIDFAVVAE